MANVSLLQLAAIMGRASTRVEVEQGRALGLIGEHVQETAKALLGHEQPEWPGLAEYTLAEKARLGLPSPSPLLRTGEHIRDTIEHVVEGHDKVEIGSNSQVAVWQEFGTGKIPPRPFLGLAAVKEEHAIIELMGEAMMVAINGGTLRKP